MPPVIVVAPRPVIVTLPPLDPSALAVPPSAPVVSMLPLTVILPPLVTRSTKPPPRPVVLEAVVIEAVAMSPVAGTGRNAGCRIVGTQGNVDAVRRDVEAAQIDIVARLRGERQARNPSDEVQVCVRQSDIVMRLERDRSG